jgi:hypothetical protein
MMNTFKNRLKINHLQAENRTIAQEKAYVV